jgi:hypothetical protein
MYLGRNSEVQGLNFKMVPRLVPEGHIKYFEFIAVIGL